MTTTGAGRPRLSTRKRPGATARDEILDAAAELFTTGGFTSTSTRMIADAVGIRQASLYHHFANKDDLLTALLVGTVTSPLAFAEDMRESPESAAVRMYALTWFDAQQLANSRWNLGALYLLPELRTERFEPFRAQRGTLMDLYTAFARDALVQINPDREVDLQIAQLPFRLVETVINTRSDAEAEGSSASPSPEVIADASIRILGWTGSTTELASRTTALLDEYSGGQR
ncbi:TetR/AcrR family transcriptional regulator [Rhodococcus sp. ACPA4]|jgi:AcrR family transcriptional regulator|uniref:TetR family transcriptional regulator n=1 Tax=Nocardia globerula TaxID=1818 RepID=A0A652YJT5_NOCGL|nr:MULTISPECIES: TetR/AcrR family transcriptional regulator [Rhodococcus]NMD62025.1 TetR/AcrR family transcriptional regulator [Nocardia globerula]PBC40857.1 TetR/AcrR family transcriptional regulator [Rhodococcus sp. ACPA4]PVX65888.1 TetR family transcriptional regulator [Rhodococcus globerulus]ROZ46003.1 TetR/AcrR family transcriptional regulator [Rhodococcus sp. WS3]